MRNKKSGKAEVGLPRRQKIRRHANTSTPCVTWVLLTSVANGTDLFVLEEDKRATTNVQNGLIFFVFFSKRNALILSEVLRGKIRKKNAESV